jgi:hypothetical protein
LASAQKVRREYEVLEFHDEEGIEDFAMGLSGDPKPDNKVALKFLRIAQPRLKQLLISIETLLVVSTVTLEEVTSQLRRTAWRHQLRTASCT